LNVGEPRTAQIDRTLTTATYFASLAVIGLVYGATAPTLQSLATQAGVGLGTIGVILSARSLGYLVGASQLGRFLDRRGGHRFMAGILIACAILLAWVPVMRSLWSLALLMGFIGCTLAGPDVGSNTLMLRLRRDRPGPYMNALHLFFGLGALLSPLLVAATRSEGSVAAPYRWLALVVALIGGAFLFRPEPTIPARGSDVEESTQVRRTLLLACIPFALYVGAEVGFSSWVFEFARAMRTELGATSLTAAFWIAFTAFRFVGVLVAMKVSPFRVVMTCFVTGIAASGLLLASSSSSAGVWLGTILLGAGIAAIYPTFILLLGERMTMTGRRLGIVAVASTVGSMTFPWMIGRFFTSWGPEAVPLIVGADLAIASLVVAVVFRRPRSTTPTAERRR